MTGDIPVDPRLRAPVDPWAGSPVLRADDQTAELRPVDPTLTDPAVPQTVAGATRVHAGRRPFGAVYCVQTPADPDKYVGKAGPRKRRDGGTSPCAPARRVEEHRRNQPWGHEISPGRAGYRVLEWVLESGHGRAYDEANLRYREAVWISRVNPTENDVRPIPVPPEQALAHKPAPVMPPVPAPVRRTTAAPRRRRRVPWFRLVSFAGWVVFWAAILIRPLSASPYPWAPWALGPALALVLAWCCLWRVRRWWDRLITPGARPPARRRRSRR